MSAVDSRSTTPVATNNAGIPLSSPFKAGRRSGRGQYVAVTFSAANSDTIIPIALGHKPSIYVPVGKTAACDVYNGSNQGTDWSAFQIVLRGTVATTVNLWVA